MIDDWTTNKKLIDKWLKVVGSKEYPLGDIYREVIINPTILSVMLCTCLEQSQNDEDCWNSLTLTKDLVHNIREYLNNGKTMNDAIDDWYTAIKNRKEINLLSGKNILDLGAGEGYLGRWLNELGMGYRGIDVSEKLVIKGNHRSGRKTAVNKKSEKVLYDLFCADLEAADEKLLYCIDATWKPDFIIFNCSIEHILSPVDFVETLGTYLLDKNPSADVILLVSNSDYNIKNGLCDASQYNNVCEVEIASIKEVVKVVPRHWSEYAWMFRAGHFQCKNVLSLYLPKEILRYGSNQIDSIRLESIDKTKLDIAPFQLLEFRLTPAVIRQAGSQDIKSVLESQILLSASPLQRDTLAKNWSECSVYCFRAGAKMFNEHDIGGHIFIVIEGSAHLINVDIPFFPGESIGELEIRQSLDDSPTFFKYSCKAGENGCVVLDIPPDVVSILMQQETNISNKLFAQITRKLRSEIWLGNLDSKRIVYTEGSFEKFANRNTYIPKLASALVSIFQRAADYDQRCPLPGDTAFIAMKFLSDRAFPTHSVVRDTTMDSCSALVGLGIIDAFPMRSILEEASGNDPEDLWFLDFLKEFRERVIFDVLTAFLQVSDFNEMSRQIKDHLDFGIRLDADRHLRHFRDPMSSIRVAIKRTSQNEKIELAELMNRVYQAYVYLDLVYSWLNDGKPSFFIARDPRLLRMIASAELRNNHEPHSDLVNLLDARAEIMGMTGYRLKNVIGLRRLSKGRLERYISVFERFVSRDLESSSKKLHFSGLLDENYHSVSKTRLSFERMFGFPYQS